MVYPHTFRTEHSETKTTNATYGEYYARQLKKQLKIQAPLLKILQYVDSNRNQFLKNLEEAIAIPSISGEMKYRDEVWKMIKFTEGWLVKLGVKYECFNIGFHELDGKKVRLPPIILATIGTDSKKKTICVYTYQDVNHPIKERWNTDPWKLVEIDKRFYGCGVAGGKVSLISWFNIIEAFQKSNTELPVNIKFVIESMHNQDCAKLEEFLSNKKQEFFMNVDYVIVCDSEWIGEKHPCIVYGSVGILHFAVTVEKVEGSDSDPREDMKKLFEKIADEKEHILIPNFNDYVQQINPDEEQLYEKIQDFDIEEVRASLPEYKQKWDKAKLLMHFWRLPSIIVHEIQECTCDKQDKSKIRRDFVIKIVPRQIMDKSVKMTYEHINNVCKDLKIGNKVDTKLISSSRSWVEDSRSPNFEAARRATIQIYKEDPNMIREDCPMKAVTLLNVVLEKNVVVLPLGDKHINTGGDNENIPKKNYYEGIKLLAAYLFQVSYLKN